MRLTFDHCLGIIKKQQARHLSTKKLANNTYLKLLNTGNFAIQYHNTDIVQINADDSFTVNIDGWNTVSTRARLNKFVPARFCTKNGIMYVSSKSGTIPYCDGLAISADGEIVSLDKITEKAEQEKKVAQQLQKLIQEYKKAYAKHYIAKVKEIEEADTYKQSHYQTVNIQKSFEDSGDCFICRFMLPSSGLEHVYSHLKEEYCVSALLYRMIEEDGSCGSLVAMMVYRDAVEGKSTMLKQIMTRYFRKHFAELLNFAKNDDGEQHGEEE